MRAAVLRQGRMVVDEIDDLRPVTGQVLVETIACGICGSDLHTVDHGRELSEVSRELGRPTFDFDPDQDMVMGHEFSVRVLEAGPGVEGIRPDTVMTARPFLTLPDGRRVTTGFNNTYPGGYSQQMLLGADALLPVPNGLDPALAALPSRSSSRTSRRCAGPSPPPWGPTWCSTLARPMGARPGSIRPSRRGRLMPTTTTPRSSSTLSACRASSRPR